MKPYLAVAALMVITPACAQEKPSAIHEANDRLGRGINLGNALDAPSEGEWGVSLKAEYFKAIKDAGFETVRLPVKWSAHTDKEAPYAIDEEFAKRVDWAIDQAVTHDLNIIVNVHHYDEIVSEPDAHFPRLKAIWAQLAERFKDRPANLYLELLNEPHSGLTPEKWNAMIPELLSVVRKSHPTRPVLVGPGEWNSIRTLDKLELPEDDRHLILTVHTYDPFQFTHQGASWVDGAREWLGTEWTGTDAQKQEIRERLGRAAAWAKEHDRPVFLGEFGVFQAADMESRVEWTRFMVQEMERLGFSWAYWEFCSGFGAYDPEAEEWRKPLKSALLD